jgi:hypothetical protein
MLPKFGAVSVEKFRLRFATLFIDKVLRPASLPQQIIEALAVRSGFHAQGKAVLQGGELEIVGVEAAAISSQQKRLFPA